MNSKPVLNDITNLATALVKIVFYIATYPTGWANGLDRIVTGARDIVGNGNVSIVKDIVDKEASLPGIVRRVITEPAIRQPVVTQLKCL